MTATADLAELVAVITGAGLSAVTVLSGDTATPPVVVVPMPSLERGTRTAGGEAVLLATADLTAVAAPDELLPYLDAVLVALTAGGVLVTDAAPTTYGGGDTVNPLPAYRVTVAWPFTVSPPPTPAP